VPKRNPWGWHDSSSGLVRLRTYSWFTSSKKIPLSSDTEERGKGRDLVGEAPFEP
jgi:hypothetical protein